MSRKLLNHDQRYRKQFGCELICGVDEAGRGALAGPVVVGCVVLGPEARLPGVNDSKLLKHEARCELVPAILKQARAWRLGWCTAAQIDEINILEATLHAAERALAELTVEPELLLTDFLKIKAPPCRCEPLVDGDALSLAIAAASILAKVARDRIMQALEAEYPQYGFAAHKGYGTELHWARLAEFGPCTLHRMTFRGVAPEPFFGQEELEMRALLRCASRAELAGQTRPRPDGTLLLDLTQPCNPLAFLPDCEWDCVGAAGSGSRVAGFGSQA